MNKDTYVNKMVDMLGINIQALSIAQRTIDTDFSKIINILLKVKRSIVFIGIGKSGLVSQKVAATYRSLGIAAQYLPAIELLHGDIGSINPDDLVFIISKSGRSNEIVNILPYLESKKISLLSITSDETSPLATASTHTITIPQVQEIDKDNIVPTSSTIVQMAVADALGVILAEAKGLNEFKAAHPAGLIGVKNNTLTANIMKTDKILQIAASAPLEEIVYSISKGMVGAVCVGRDHIEGIITDGDLRRMLANNYSRKITAKDIMTPSPKSIDSNRLAIEAVEIMKNNKISQLIVTDDEKFVGIIHIHDCLKIGL